MAPGGGRQSVKHRIRRMHPMRHVMTRTLATLERADADEIRRYQERQQGLSGRTGKSTRRAEQHQHRVIGDGIFDMREAERQK